MATRGRRKIEIDYATLEELCAIQATLPEIAGVLRVSEDTVERRCNDHYGENFAEVFKKYSAPGLISLRRLQFRMAESVPALAIFLGKQYLGQSDKVETKSEVRAQVSADSQRRMLSDPAAMELACALDERISGPAGTPGDDPGGVRP